MLAGGLVIRAVTRALVKQTPHIGFAVKALTAAAGTYGMGRALVSLYERDVDYSCANEVVTATFSRVRDLVTTVAALPVLWRPIRTHLISLLRGFPLRVAYQDCFHLIEPLLAKVEKPSRYIDHEWASLPRPMPTTVAA